MLRIGNVENVFVTYSYPRFDCKLNASLFDLHGPSLSFLCYTCLPLWTYSYSVHFRCNLHETLSECSFQLNLGQDQNWVM